MAQIDLKFDGELLVVTVTGNATSQELIDVINEYYPKKEVTDVLWDFTNGSWHLIPKHGFRDVAMAAKLSVENGTRGGSKTVFVGTAGLEFGLHRMYQAIAETSGVPIKYCVFTTVDEAKNWIAS